MAQATDIQDVGLLQYELEQAWQVMRHHEMNATDAIAARRHLQLRMLTLGPKASAYGRIANLVQEHREGHISSAEFAAQVDSLITATNHQIHLVEEAQASARKG